MNDQLSRASLSWLLSLNQTAKLCQLTSEADQWEGNENFLWGNSLAVQWLGLQAFTTGAWVRSLVGGLRSLKCAAAKKKKKNFLWQCFLDEFSSYFFSTLLLTSSNADVK